jgi:phage shock protein B
MIQEMYQAMSRMEARVETLETILLEKDGKEKSS